MIIIKWMIISGIFLTSFMIGNLISKKYILRVKELKDLKNALNIIESKIKFTYEPIPEIFHQTSRMFSKNIEVIFEQAATYMRDIDAEKAWNKSLEESITNLNKEDIENIRSFGKMLGKTDKEGQVSSLELTKNLIEMQIEKAKVEEEKNAKMYRTLGSIMGLAFVIMLI